MKCRKCSQKAVIKIYQHNLPLCKEHFLEFEEERVRKAIQDFQMIERKEKLLVVVSGGKDSLSVAYMLKKMGYTVHLLHINLGIGKYSLLSQEKCEKFSSQHSLPLTVISLVEEWGKGIGELAHSTYKSTCSLCGMVKRYYFNKFAYENGFDAVVTGHNLDDMTSALLANILGWRISYMVKQTPVLREEGKLKKKVKPLIYLTERETAAYAFLSSIDYIREECPFSANSTFLKVKHALNEIEKESPGTKFSFYRGLLKNLHLFKEKEKKPLLRECAICGFPTIMEVCSFCKTLRKEEVKKYASHL